MPRLPAGNDYAGWVALLGSNARRQLARRHLVATGPPAVPAIRRGLQDGPPMVRRLCASILDQLADDESVPALVAALDDEDAEVCARALHALACDACKQNACRPGDELFVPRALEIFRDHPDIGLRAAAIDALGRAARRNPELVPEIAAVIEREPNPTVRNLARRRLRVRLPVA